MVLFTFSVLLSIDLYLYYLEMRRSITTQADWEKLIAS